MIYMQLINMHYSNFTFETFPCKRFSRFRIIRIISFFVSSLTQNLTAFSLVVLPFFAPFVSGCYGRI